jgi:hypothetical protein
LQCAVWRNKVLKSNIIMHKQRVLSIKNCKIGGVADCQSSDKQTRLLYVENSL